MRFAAGVCVLAAGLLMGCPGGAVAVADTPSSDSAAQGDGSINASAQDSATARSLVGHVTDSLRETIRGVTSTLGSGRQPGQHRSTGASPKKESGSTDDENNTGLVAAVPNAVAPVTDVTAPVADVVAPVPNVVAPVSDVIVAAQDMLTSVASSVVPYTSARRPFLLADVGDRGDGACSDRIGTQRRCWAVVHRG